MAYLNSVLKLDHL